MHVKEACLEISVSREKIFINDFSFKFYEFCVIVKSQEILCCKELCSLMYKWAFTRTWVLMIYFFQFLLFYTGTGIFSLSSSGSLLLSTVVLGAPSFQT